MDEERLQASSEKITDYKVEDDPVFSLSIFHYGTCVEIPKSEKASSPHDLYSFLEQLPRYSNIAHG